MGPELNSVRLGSGHHACTDGSNILCTLGVCVAAAALLRSPVPVSDWFSNPEASFMLAQGENPAPVMLVRPEAAPLSLMAQLGKQIFYDPSLSSSGRLSCSSCHSPQHNYGPAGDAPAIYGGPDTDEPGRARRTFAEISRPRTEFLSSAPIPRAIMTRRRRPCRNWPPRAATPAA